MRSRAPPSSANKEKDPLEEEEEPDKIITNFNKSADTGSTNKL